MAGTKKLLLSILQIVVILLIVAITNSLLNLIVSRRHHRAAVKFTQQQQLDDNENKHVQFGTDVKIGTAGGRKFDRYNPDLKSCVQRNAELATKVGGAKRLAELSLLEAEDSSSSSR